MHYGCSLCSPFSPCHLHLNNALLLEGTFVVAHIPLNANEEAISHSSDTAGLNIYQRFPQHSVHAPGVYFMRRKIIPLLPQLNIP